MIQSGSKAVDPHKAPKRILIVDDDRHTAKALGALLIDEGFHPTVYFSGSDAMRNLDGQTFDAVLVDVHLPDMNGLVLSQRLRDRLGPTVPIVVVSGDTSMETLNSLSHVGATYFLAKPMSPQLLLERLHTHLGK